MKHTTSELLTQQNAENTAEIIICPAEMKQVLNWLNSLQETPLETKELIPPCLVSVETSKLHFFAKGINA